MGGPLHMTLLTSVASSWVEMKPITMVCFLFSAGALTLIYLGSAGRRRNIGAMLLGGMVVVVGLATIVDYVSQLVVGQPSVVIDSSLLNLFLASQTRMALMTAVIFTLVGFALILLAFGSRRSAHVAHMLAFPAAIVSYVAPLSYLLGVQSMSAVLGTPMALNTGIAFCFLCLAVFASRTDTWLMAALTGDGVGAFMARRLLPALMAAPVVIGWLRLQGERSGLFSSEVGVALVAATYTVVFVVLVWLAARAANRTDAHRRGAELAIRESEERLRRTTSLLEAVTTGTEVIVAAVDTDFRYLFFNQAYREEIERLGGMGLAVGASMRDVFAHMPELQRAAIENWGRTLTGDVRGTYRMEFGDLGRYRRTYSARQTLIRDGQGAIVAAGEVASDITEQVKAEEALRRNEATMRGILDATRESIWLFSAEGVVLQANAMALTRFGKASPEVVGKSMEEILSPELARLRRARLQEVVEAARPVEFEDERAGMQFRHSFYPVTDAEGRVTAVVSFSRDITESKRAEQALRDSEGKFRIVADNTYDFEFWLDPDGKYVYVSPSCERITGYKPAEFLADPELRFRIAHPEDRQMLVDHVRSAERDEPGLLDHRIIHRDGSVRWIGHVCQPIYGSDGRFLGTRGSNRDITERKVAEEALRRSRERQAILADTAAALLATSRPHELVEQLCRRVMEHLDCQVFVNFLVDEPSHRLRLNACAGVPPTKVKLLEWLDFGQAVCGAVAESGAPIAVDHIQSVPDPRATLVKSLGADAYCCHPLLSKGKVIGTLSFGATTRPVFSDEDRAMMKAVSDLVSMAMEHVLSEKTLRENEERLRKLYSAMSEGMALHRMVYDESGKATDYRILDVNPSFEAITGIGRDKAVGRLASELYGTGSPPYIDIYAKVAATSEPAEFETEFAPMAKCFHISVFSPGKDAFATVFTDITERKQAERRLTEQALMLASANDAIIGYDTDYHVMFWNRSAEVMYGYSEAEALGRASTDLFHPVYVGATREQMVERIAADGHAEVESLRTTRDGRQLSVEAHVIVLRDEQGLTTGYVSVDRDITERKRAEAELREAKETLEVKVKERTAELTDEIEERKRAEQRLTAASQYARSLIESSLDPLVTINAEGRITDVNEATVKATGATRVELVGTDFCEYFTEPEKAGQGYRRVFAEGLVTDYPLTIRHRDGHLTDVLYNASVYRDAAGVVTGVFAAARDVTARKRAEEALRKAYDTLEVRVAERTAELKRSNEELEQFAYVASHDLQEPLRMVASYVQLLGQRYKGQLDEKADKYIAFASGGAVRMHQLVNDLLAFSRVGTRAAPLAPVILDRVVAQARENLTIAIEQSGAAITVSRLPTVSGDETQLVQLFQNLMDNAIKFRSKQPPKVSVSCHDAGNKWQFEVRDNGIGIDPKQGDRIFRLFQRLHTQEEYSGTGIGLAVCKKIVERHGGSIRVESEPGKGSAFIFTLPKRDEAEAKVEVRPEEPGTRNKEPGTKN